MSKLEDFGNDEAVAAEYSDVKECPLSDSGYHCSCYDHGKACDICEQEPPNYYRGPVRSGINNNWAPTSGPGIPDNHSIKE